MSDYITLQVKGANEMNIYLSKPQEAGVFPALMLFQEAFGVNHHIRNVADRLAKEGYIVVAPELYHRTAPKGFESPYTDFDAIKPHTSVLNNTTLEADIQACYDWLQKQDNVQKDKIGAIGFCMGGRVAYIANSFLPLKAAVSFYGGYLHTITDRAGKLSGPQLFFWGGKDQHIVKEYRDAVINAMNEAGKDYLNVVISYADHGFFCNERAAYNADAAKEAWGMTKAFLENKLK